MDEYIEKNRYPIRTEYSIIENCISAYDAPLKTNKYMQKKNVCECALEGTQKKYSYKEYKEDTKGFLKEYEIQAINAIIKMRK